MKNLSMAILLVLFFAGQALAWDPFETKDEARQRHSAQNYDTYKNNNNRAPLGGYSSPLGDSAPAGTEYPGMRPGYGQPQGSAGEYQNRYSR